MASVLLELTIQVDSVLFLDISALMRAQTKVNKVEVKYQKQFLS